MTDSAEPTTSQEAVVPDEPPASSEEDSTEPLPPPPDDIPPPPDDIPQPDDSTSPSDDIPPPPDDIPPPEEDIPLADLPCIVDFPPLGDPADVMLMGTPKCGLTPSVSEDQNDDDMSTRVNYNSDSVETFSTVNDDEQKQEQKESLADEVTVVNGRASSEEGMSASNGIAAFKKSPGVDEQIVEVEIHQQPIGEKILIIISPNEGTLLLKFHTLRGLEKLHSLTAHLYPPNHQNVISP